MYYDNFWLELLNDIQLSSCDLKADDNTGMNMGDLKERLIDFCDNGKKKGSDSK